MPRKPAPILREGSDASRLFQESDNEHEIPIAVLEVSPLDQTHISLGEYISSRPPIGFSITITPDYEPDDVVAQIMRIDAAGGEFELVLHVANYGDKSLSVEVFRIVRDNSKNASATAM